MVFSEGRLTASNTIVADDYDKTLSLFGNTILCAFCGLIILNKPDGTGTSVKNILQDFSTANQAATFDDFIFTVTSTIKECLEATLPTEERRIDLHIVRRVQSNIGNFEFRKFSFISDVNNRAIINVTCVCTITSNNFSVDGDNAACPVIYADLSGKPGINTEADIIDRNRVTIALGTKAVAAAAVGIPSCGGCFFYKHLA
jgi:hypothetical protein